MKNSQLLKLVKDTGLSPERLSKRLGVSNMTVRRWIKKPPGTDLPPAMAKAVLDGAYQLIIDGDLDAASDSARFALSRSQGYEIQAAIKTLGLPKDFTKLRGGFDQKLTQSLSKIGDSSARKSQVDRNHKKIRSFSSWSREWSDRISVLMKVVASDKFTLADKLVAYGALFYLIWPFDLIPDSIPVIGYLDDYAILGLAAAYYLRKYQKLLNPPRDSGRQGMAPPRTI